MAKNVMLRLSEEEHERLAVAWNSSASEPWRRVPFATWCRRTLLNLFPADAKRTAKARTLDLFPKRRKRRAA